MAGWDQHGPLQGQLLSQPKDFSWTQPACCLWSIIAQAWRLPSSGNLVSSELGMDSACGFCFSQLASVPAGSAAWLLQHSKHLTEVSPSQLTPSTPAGDTGMHLQVPEQPGRSCHPRDFALWPVPAWHHPSCPCARCQSPWSLRSLEHMPTSCPLDGHCLAGPQGVRIVPL